jgi:hypothetical protein
MENLLSQFKVQGLEIKLTSEKLYINTNSSSEVFALRSVNGIGVIDLVEDYKKKLDFYNNDLKFTKSSGFASIIFAIIFIFVSIGSESGEFLFKPAIFLIGIGIFLLNYKNLKKDKKPELMSVLRVMMSGGNRDFEFSKHGNVGNEIENFVSKVESTLTAYQKRND